METTRIKIILSVFGENFNLTELTNLININATNYWNKGDSVKNRNNLKRKETAWNYSSEFKETLFFDEFSSEFLNVFKNKAKLIKKIIDENKLESKIYIVVEIVDHQKPSLFFNRDFLNFINEMNAEIDIDLYLLND